jgi:hypothetical protein
MSATQVLKKGDAVKLSEKTIFRTSKKNDTVTVNAGTTAYVARNGAYPMNGYIAIGLAKNTPELDVHLAFVNPSSLQKVEIPPNSFPNAAKRQTRNRKAARKTRKSRKTRKNY